MVGMLILLVSQSSLHNFRNMLRILIIEKSKDTQSKDTHTMRRIQFTIILSLLLVSIINLQNSYAQDFTKWDLPEGAKTRIGKGTVVEVAYSPDGSQLAVGGSIGIWIYDAETGEEIRLLTGHTAVVLSVSFSPDGETLASSSYDDTVRLWDVSSGSHLHTLTGHTDAINSVSFSPDGKTVASGSWDDTVRLWDVSSGENLRTFTGHWDQVNSISFSPDGVALASGSDDGTIRLWDVSSGQIIRAFGRGWDFVRSVSFSPDGVTLASGSDDGTVILWDVSSGSHLRTFTAQNLRVFSTSFSPDGEKLASANSDDTIRLWDVKSGENLSTLTGHTGLVLSVSFGPYGEMLASGSLDHTVRLWDVSSGSHLRTFTGHTGFVRSVSISPDGETLASGSDDGTILLWELVPAPTSNTTVSLSPDSLVSPYVGEQLTLSLNISEGANVAGYQATVSFDPFALKYVESSNRDYLPSGVFSIPPILDRNRVQIGATSLAGESEGEGTLATITFEVVAVKASKVRLSNVILTDSSGGSTIPKTESAEITELTLRPEDVNRDGVVNIIDLTLVATNFGKIGKHAADVNGDRIVNIIDLTLVAAAFVNIAAPSALLSLNSDTMPSRATVEEWLQEARQLNLTDPNFQHGIAILEQLLIALTPKKTALLSNYPNPFNPETWIPYQLAAPAAVSISIYAFDGKLVRTLDLGHQEVGLYESQSQAAHWDGKNESGESVASGVYFYTFTAGSFSATRKMLIMK